MPYLIGRGDLFIADRETDGNPKALAHIGECSMFEFNVGAEYVDNFETSSGLNRQDAHILLRQTAELSLVMKEPTADNLSLALYGEKVSVTGASLTNQLFPTGIVAGEVRRVPGGYMNLSAVTIRDSAGSPATLIANTDYVLDAMFGTVEFRASGVTGKTQPFKIDFTYASTTEVALCKKRSAEKWVLFKGINIADGDKKFAVEFYRAAFEPATKLPMKTNEIAEFEIRAAILNDSTKTESGSLGKFGRYRILE
jgi:hypothetical protein